MECHGCGEWAVVEDTINGNDVCTECGLCAENLTIGWDAADKQFYDRARLRVKSEHNKSKYFGKKVAHSEVKVTSLDHRCLANLFSKAKSVLEGGTIKTERKYQPAVKYQLRQLLSLLGLEKQAKEIPLLKGKKELRALDHIWEQVCRACNWQFTPLAEPVKLKNGASGKRAKPRKPHL